MWVRGLKLDGTLALPSPDKSHPMWVRGLKPIDLSHLATSKASHPMWVRGLKQRVGGGSLWKRCRTPCGCVD